jgi:hypothetical protein
MEKIKIDGYKVGDLYKLATNLADGYGTEASVTVQENRQGTFLVVTPKERK